MKEPVAGPEGGEKGGCLAPTVVESAGCITAALDRAPDCHSVVARLLRKGAVSFVGNAREGGAPPELQRMEFWTAVLAGKTIGQAHRQSINSALTAVLDQSQDPSGAFAYQLHTDGSATYRRVVCLADFDQIHGTIVNTIDRLDYQVVEL